MLHDVPLDILSQLDISNVGEQPAWYLFGKSFFLVVWIVDWHVQDRFLQALVFTLRVGLNHESSPGLEAFGRQAWNIGSFLKVVKLDQVVLCFHLTEQPRDRGCVVVKNV